MFNAVPPKSPLRTRSRGSAPALRPSRPPILHRKVASAVGSYDITATLNDPGAKPANYPATKKPAKLTPRARLAPITADPKTKVYGETDPGLTYQVTNGNLVTVMSLLEA